MRFVAISDTHLAKPSLPEGDVLLNAGDLALEGTLPELSGAAAWLEEQKRAKGYEHVIVIAGNHDWPFQREPGLARQIDMEDDAGHGLPPSSNSHSSYRLRFSPW